ncbi:MAG TPA: tellurite resistance TerB family protein [Desulfobulbaceae bacterium]|nr:tellurite resistance TerB family protein [Desulfobulbaceae bacterium]
MDILGSMMQQGMSQSTGTRMANALGAGGSGGSLSDILGGLAGALGGGRQSAAAPQAGLGGLGNLGGVVGEVLGSLGNNKAALGGLGALAGALLGGGQSSARGAIGGGGLAMLASLAIAALRKAGQTPQSTPRALLEPQTAEDQQALEQDAEIIVKAMINAAKADGRIDDNEIQKIVGKLQEDGLTEEEKEFFMTEANKPMDIDAVIASAAGQPETAAQIYSASLLAIEVDTPAEQQYMQQLAQGLGLDPRVTNHIHQFLGVQ